MRFCPNCGVETDPTNLYCGICGFPLNTNETEMSLNVSDPNNQNAFLVLNEGSKIIQIENRLLFGKNQQCDLRLDADYVADKHFIIRNVKKDYEITDLGSETGVYVNGVRIKHSQLSNNDVISVSDFIMVFKQDHQHE